MICEAGCGRNAMIPRRPTAAEIIEAACFEAGVTPEDLRGPSRHRRITHARRLAAAALRQLLHMSWSDIGRAIGKPHNTCVEAARHADPGAVDRVITTLRMVETGTLPRPRGRWTANDVLNLLRRYGKRHGQLASHECPSSPVDQGVA